MTTTEPYAIDDLVLVNQPGEGPTQLASYQGMYCPGVIRLHVFTNDTGEYEVRNIAQGYVRPYKDSSEAYLAKMRLSGLVAVAGVLSNPVDGNPVGTVFVACTETDSVGYIPPNRLADVVRMLVEQLDEDERAELLGSL